MLVALQRLEIEGVLAADLARIDCLLHLVNRAEDVLGVNLALASILDVHAQAR